MVPSSIFKIMDKTKTRKCADKTCQNEFTPYNSLQKYCSYTCIRKNEKKAGEGKKFGIMRKPIRNRSQKGEAANREYLRIRAQFFMDPANRSCRVYPGQRATDIHHKMGRQGYADEWARERGISLLVDTRFWLPVCREAHDQIEKNPAWAYEMGYSIQRSQRL